MNKILDYLNDHLEFIFIVCMIIISLYILCIITEKILDHIKRYLTDLNIVYNIEKKLNITLSNLEKNHIDKQDFYHVLLLSWVNAANKQLITKLGKYKLVEIIMSFLVKAEELIRQKEPEFNGLQYSLSIVNSSVIYTLKDKDTAKILKRMKNAIK